jgi:DNA-binding CsgD family transcriptional regulator
MPERTVEKRTTPWLDLVAALLHAPTTSFPVDAFLDQFHDTFGTQNSWNWVDPDGSYGFRMWQPIAGWPTPDEMDFFAGPQLDLHPLIRWYRATGDLTPMSITRVPRPLATREGVNMLREHLTPVELDQQMCVPYRASRSQQRTFVLSKTKRDFSDSDLAVARRIQPLLSLVARQHDVLAGRACQCHGPGGVGVDRVAATFGLTARETAVLKLLADGLTATAIGRRLAISTRTVHVHLEHLYRKLGVHDRLMAVRVAEESGLWLPVAGRIDNEEIVVPAARDDPRVHRPRDVVGQRVVAWIPGTGVVRAGAPY